jgi:hypothetical protein
LDIKICVVFWKLFFILNFIHLLFLLYLLEAAVHEAGRVTGSTAHQTSWSAVSATIVLTLAAILC